MTTLTDGARRSCFLVGGILRLADVYEAPSSRRWHRGKQRPGDATNEPNGAASRVTGSLRCTIPHRVTAEERIMKHAIWAVCSCAATLILFAMIRATEPARLAQKLHRAELAVLGLCLGRIVMVVVGWLFTRASWALAEIRDCNR